MEHLVSSSIHGIERLVKRSMMAHTDESDAKQVGLVAFMTSVHGVPMGQRLWSVARFAIVREVTTYATDSASSVPVPHATASRYLDAMRGSETLAEAQQRATATGHMRADVFYSVHAAMQGCATVPVETQEMAARVDVYDTEKAEYLDGLLCLLPERSATIVRMSVGMDGAPMTDSEIAQVLHSSQQTVNRLRNQALALMREMANQ